MDYPQLTPAQCNRLDDLAELLLETMEDDVSMMLPDADENHLTAVVIRLSFVCFGLSMVNLPPEARREIMEAYLEVLTEEKYLPEPGSRILDS